MKFPFVQCQDVTMLRFSGITCNRKEGPPFSQLEPTTVAKDNSTGDEYRAPGASLYFITIVIKFS